MTKAIKRPDGKIVLAAAKRDATEEAIDFHTDKVMMAAIKDDGMDLPTLKRLVTAVTPRNVIVALEHMKGTELSKLCKRIGLDGIPHSSNEGMRNAILTALDLETEPADGEEIFDHGLIFVLPADATGRYDYIEIFDSSNADGYVEIAQLGIGPIDFVPSYNAAYGLKDGFVSFGGKERSSGGTLWTDQQRIARNVSFVLEAIDLDNGDSLHELERYVGTTEQVLYLPDLHDAAAIQRYGMRGTLDELSALDYPYYRLRSMPLRITQD